MKAPATSPSRSPKLRESGRREQARRKRIALVSPGEVRVERSRSIGRTLRPFARQATEEAAAWIDALGGPDRVSPQRCAITGRPRRRVGLSHRDPLRPSPQRAPRRSGSTASSRTRSTCAATSRRTQAITQVPAPPGRRAVRSQSRVPTRTRSRRRSKRRASARVFPVREHRTDAAAQRQRAGVGPLSRRRRQGMSSSESRSPHILRPNPCYSKRQLPA